MHGIMTTLNGLLLSDKREIDLTKMNENNGLVVNSYWCTLIKWNFFFHILNDFHIFTAVWKCKQSNQRHFFDLHNGHSRKVNEFQLKKWLFTYSTFELCYEWIYQLCSMQSVSVCAWTIRKYDDDLLK